MIPSNGSSETIDIVEVKTSDGPFPILRYEYVTDKHYAVKITKARASWQIDLILKDLPHSIKKSSEGTLFAPHVEEPRAFVAKSHDDAIGWMEVGLQRWNNRMRVWHLLVEEGFRRKGIGSQLMGVAIGKAKEAGARMLILETQSCNVPAISFYLKHGFELVGLDSTSYSNDDLEKGEVRFEFGKRI